MFDNLFGKLNSNSQEFVGVSLNTNGLLEVIQTSRTEKEVTKYTNRYVAYDQIERTVEDYSALRNELESALNELGIAPKGCNIIFSLPNVLFGITKNIPFGFELSELGEALLTDVESEFIFSKTNPRLSWAKVGETGANQIIAYSAIQENTVRELKELCGDIGANLISVQNSFSTMIGGLAFSEKLEYMLDDGSLNILVISPTSYSVFNFENSHLNNYYEEPLAVKSFSGEEVYTAICTMAGNVIHSMPASKILVISEAEDVSAAVICQKLAINPSKDRYIEQSSKFQTAPIIDVNLNVLPKYVPHISLSAIGTSVDYGTGNPVQFNYLDSGVAGKNGVNAPDLIEIGGSVYELTPAAAVKVAVIFVVIILAIFAGLFFTMQSLTNTLKSELDSLSQKEKQLETELKSYKTVKPKVIDISSSMNEVVNTNRKKMLYYDALSYGIPEKLWIERFYVGTGNAVGIKGASVESSDIAAFLRGIREVTGETEVSVTQLDVIGSDDIINSNNEPEIYSFELANSAYASVAKTQAKSQKTQTGSSNRRGNLPSAGEQSKVPPVIPVD